MYRSPARTWAIRIKSLIKCNHPLEYIEPFTWNDKMLDGTYGPQYPGFICGLCYGYVEMPISIVRRYPQLKTEDKE